MAAASALERVLQRAARDLSDCGVQFAGVGGLAVSARVEPRLTRDPDLAASLPVARTGLLLVMKLLARDDRRRPNDADDLARLVEVVTPGEIDRAREAAQLVCARGFGRGRDLPALLDALLGEHGPLECQRRWDRARQVVRGGRGIGRDCCSNRNRRKHKLIELARAPPVTRPAGEPRWRANG